MVFVLVAADATAPAEPGRMPVLLLLVLVLVAVIVAGAATAAAAAGSCDWCQRESASAMKS